MIEISRFLPSDKTDINTAFLHKPRQTLKNGAMLSGVYFLAFSQQIAHRAKQGANLFAHIDKPKYILP